MNLYELWEVCIVVGEIEIFDDEGLDVTVKSISEIVLDINHPHHDLQHREVAYFSTYPAINELGHKLVIKLKERN